MTVIDLEIYEVEDPIDIPFVNAEDSGSGGSVSWGAISGKPSSFSPSAHTHNQPDVNGLVPLINSLQDDIDDLEEDFDYATNLEAYLTPGL